MLKDENVDLLKRNGVLFFLDRSPERLIPTDDRPLASSREAILSRYRERLPVYTRAADVTIPNDGAPEAAAEETERRFLQ